MELFGNVVDERSGDVKHFKGGYCQRRRGEGTRLR